MTNPFDPEDIPDQALWEISLGGGEEYELWQIEQEDKAEGPSVESNERVARESAVTFRHNRIKSYQKDKSKQFRVKPSCCMETYWLYASRQKGHYSRSTDRSGKWLIFLPPEEIDSAWQAVKSATIAGKLGNDSKASTKLGHNGGDYVICVYTYDWKDYDDCYRIRQELRGLGIEKPIPYKTDSDTLAGKYSNKGDKRIAKYYE